MEKRFLNIQESSQYLGFAESTIYSWVSQRKIPFVKKGGRLRFDKQKLEDWMQQDEHEVIEDKWPE